VFVTLSDNHILTLSPDDLTVIMRSGKAMCENGLSFWRGVLVNRPTCLCIEKDSQFRYLIIYDIFTFKVWFGNKLHRSMMKVPYCAIGFCKETNEQRMKTFSSEHPTNRNKDSKNKITKSYLLSAESQRGTAK